MVRKIDLEIFTLERGYSSKSVRQEILGQEKSQEMNGYIRKSNKEMIAS